VRRLLAVVALLGAVVVGCGVPEDDSPQELSADEVPFGLLTVPTTTTEPGPVTDPERQGRLYFVDTEGQIVEVEAEVPDQSVRSVLIALLDTDPETLDPGVSSFIPPETTLRRVEVVDDVIVIDLSEEFTSVTSERFVPAVAQVVFTATAVSGTGASLVEFREEGEPIDVPDEDGAAQSDPVSRTDYRGLLAVNG